MSLPFGTNWLRRTAMEVKKIYVGEIPPESGPRGERIIVLFGNGTYDSILTEDLTAYQLANELKMLAERIETNILEHSHD